MPIEQTVRDQIQVLEQRVSDIQDASQHRRVIYTCITNNYSRLLTPPDRLRQQADFVLFSDEDTVVEGWNTVPIAVALSDPRRTAKLLKILPHTVFGSYDLSFWMDGNFRLESALQDLMDDFAETSTEMLLIRHGKRSCLYEEVQVCIRWGKDKPEILRQQVKNYEQMGHPRQAGLFMGGFLMRKHNRTAVAQAMDYWWNEVQTYSVRDQISLPVALRKYGVAVTPVPHADLPKYIEIMPHKKYRTYSSNKFSLWNLRATLGAMIYNYTIKKAKKE